MRAAVSGAIRAVNIKNIESATGVLVDWGTTNLRAYLVNNAGEVLDTRNSDLGIRNVEEGDFRGAIESLLDGWGSTLPVLMAGMIGSAQGWVEARYATCPSAAADIAGDLTAIPDHSRFSITPGVSYRAPDGSYDVMRGEEVQIFGALELAKQQDATLCLPGTHSKWAYVEGGVLTKFYTSMTGEVYAILKSHSILGALMGDDAGDDAAFEKGLSRSGAAGGLLHHLFSTRTNGLFSRISPDGLPSYMSGILIGHELRNCAPVDPDKPVLLVSQGVLGERYTSALKYFGIAAQLISAEEATVCGLNMLQKIGTMKVSR